MSDEEKINGLMQIIESQKQTFDALAKKAKENEAAVRDLAGALEFTGDMTNNVRSRKASRAKTLKTHAETIKRAGGD